MSYRYVQVLLKNDLKLQIDSKVTLNVAIGFSFSDTIHFSSSKVAVVWLVI